MHPGQRPAPLTTELSELIQDENEELTSGHTSHLTTGPSANQTEATLQTGERDRERERERERERDIYHSLTLD